MSLLVLGVNHRTAPLKVRERLTIDEGSLPSALESLASQVAPGVILSTCNRLEVYTLSNETAGEPEPVSGLRRFLSAYSGVSEDDLIPYLYDHQDGGCVRHLFRVASGLDSMVVGEWEILGQVRAAFSAASNPASEASYVKGPLSRLFHQALRVGRRVHHDSKLGANMGGLSPPLRQPRGGTAHPPLAGRPVAETGAAHRRGQRWATGRPGPGCRRGRQPGSDQPYLRPGPGAGRGTGWGSHSL